MTPPREGHPIRSARVEEIRARFIRLTLGPDVATWLDELLNGLKSSHEALSVQFEASDEAFRKLAPSTHNTQSNAVHGPKLPRNELSTVVEKLQGNLHQRVVTGGPLHSE